MNNAFNLWDQDALNELSESYPAYITDARELFVDVGIELGSDVEAWERHRSGSLAGAELRGVTGGVDLEFSPGDNLQLVSAAFGDWPLIRPAVDAGPGDTKGAGDGSLIELKVSENDRLEHYPESTS